MFKRCVALTWNIVTMHMLLVAIEAKSSRHAMKVAHVMVRQSVLTSFELCSVMGKFFGAKSYATLVVASTFWRSALPAPRISEEEWKALLAAAVENPLPYPLLDVMTNATSTVTDFLVFVPPPMPICFRRDLATEIMQAYGVDAPWVSATQYWLDEWEKPASQFWLDQWESHHPFPDRVFNRLMQFLRSNCASVRYYYNHNVLEWKEVLTIDVTWKEQCVRLTATKLLYDD